MARWLDAQNRGDFAAYQALYATMFHGIRKSGARTVELDRDGWMKDRARMFKKPMQVGAASVAISDGPDGARLDFVQTWQSGGYRDVGRKRLTLGREPAGLRIVREELLESVAPSPDITLDAVRLELLRLAGPKTRGRLVDAKLIEWSGERAALFVFGDTEELTQAHLTLVLARGAPGAQVLVARGEWDEETAAPSLGDEGSFTLGFALGKERLTLAPQDQALVVRVLYTRHENGPANDSVTREELLVYRPQPGSSGAGLIRVLRLRTVDDRGDAECGAGETSALTVADTATSGVADLREEHKVHTSRFDGRGCNDRWRTTTHLWRWNGRAYHRR